MYIFSLFGSLVVNAEILSSNEEKSAPQNNHPLGGTKQLLINLAYLLPLEGMFCKFGLDELNLPDTVPPKLYRVIFERSNKVI